MSIIVVDTSDAIEQIINTVKPELSAHGVMSIGLFGSFLRGEQTAHSDIDILLEFAPEEHTFDNFMLLRVKFLFFAKNFATEAAENRYLLLFLCDLCVISVRSVAIFIWLRPEAAIWILHSFSRIFLAGESI